MAHRSQAQEMSVGEETRIVRLRVICAPLPPLDFGGGEAIELGMQHGHEIVQGQADGVGSMRFEGEARVKRDPRTGDPNFLGPIIHGPVGGRFLYLNWVGTVDGERRDFKRMKVSLASITWEQIEAVSGSEAALLEAAVSGVGRDGGPACASVSLLGEGWIVRSAGD